MPSEVFTRRTLYQLASQRNIAAGQVPALAEQDDAPPTPAQKTSAAGAITSYGATVIRGIFQLPDVIRMTLRQDRVRWYRVASGAAHVPVPDQGYQRSVIIGVDNTDSARTVTIPSEDIGREGTIFVVKDESGGANSNNITIATEGSQTIDGSGTNTISSAYGTVRLYSNGSHLFTW